MSSARLRSAYRAMSRWTSSARTTELEGGVGVQHIFAAHLESMDLTARTGTEFAKSERDGYEVVRVPFTAEAVRELDLMPPRLAQFIAANTNAITSVFDTPLREAGGSRRRRPSS